VSDSKPCKTCLQVKPLDQFYKQRERRVAHCKDCMKPIIRARYEANAELLRQKSKDYRLANPEKVKALRRAWKQANPEKNVASVVAYQRRNPEKHAVYAKNYRDKNKDKYAVWSRNRQAKLANCKTYYISDKEIDKLYSDPCVACGSKTKQTIDHIIPIDLGGSHGIGNLQTLCLSCNSSKRNRVMTVWKKSLRKL
jgi:5-methylcytosine-specific restriction endonuclease McrA